jgi:hypothetical protein
MRVVPAMEMEEETRGPQERWGTDVLRFERMEYELTSNAIALGLDAALPVVFDLRDQTGEFGRGERGCPATTDLPITMRFAEPPEPFDGRGSA